MALSRISGFSKLSPAERISALTSCGALSGRDAAILSNGGYQLKREEADRFIENVVGVFTLPVGMAMNVRVNERDYIVPMVVEEPSIVAAVSGAAKLFREHGGIKATCEEALLIGQVHLVGVPDLEKAQRVVRERESQLVSRVNETIPGICARGGGLRGVRSRTFPRGCSRGHLLVVEILIDTRDAMGANLINKACESIAPLLEEWSGGRAILKILSNLNDRALVKAEVTIPLAALGTQHFSAEAIRDGIVLASECASLDPYRAATHNKGIMNGIDAVAIATGNDWRAIEAGAHAYAARKDGYKPLATWTCDERGNLRGQLEMPLKVGIVGAQIEAHPAVQLHLRLLGVRSARELADVMAAVGLAQNFAALRALCSEGISKGHLRLHARTVCGEGCADGKFILTGEHAVLYGEPAIAFPLPLGLACRLRLRTGSAPQISLNQRIVPPGAAASLSSALQVIAGYFELPYEHMIVELEGKLPPGKGLGFSAAFCVALVRAAADLLKIRLGTAEECGIARAAEDKIHGRSSGLDVAVSAHSRGLLFRNGAPELIERRRTLPFLVLTGRARHSTRCQIERVKIISHCALFHERVREIGELTRSARRLLLQDDVSALGTILNRNHEILRGWEIVPAEADKLVRLCRASGALGAKISGSGGGGTVVALCADGSAALSVLDAVMRECENAFFVEV